jgi:hypothetical protein
VWPGSLWVALSPELRLELVCWKLVRMAGWSKGVVGQQAGVTALMQRCMGTELSPASGSKPAVAAAASGLLPLWVRGREGHEGAHGSLPPLALSIICTHSTHRQQR